MTNPNIPAAAPLYTSSRPYTRWWWFNGEIRADDIRYQLDWLKANGFGGVEIAWLYPQSDGAGTGPQWLSPEWAQKVAFAKQYADALGLGCDFTFGTSWPFGGSNVPDQDATRVFDPASPAGALSTQRLEKSWESPVEGNIMNHLDRAALERYAASMGGALADALRGSPAALFCDSWEVLTEGLWTAGFGEAFRARFGYAIEDTMAELDNHPDERYDYRKLISDYALDEFYRPYTAICHRLNSYARVQCHGAPTDLLAAYAAVDVPESEAILFDPEFSRFAASAAALSHKPAVSAEAFTCLYGWLAKPGPGPFQKQEYIADMKLLADALFANGVNQFFWHGMPYNPPGGSNRFYATVHVGPDSAFAADIPAFNAYLEQVSRAMKQGRTYSDVAVYLPIEDTRMLGTLPPALQKPSALYHWEMHYMRAPDGLKGYQPLWVSQPFLHAAHYADDLLQCGDATFSSLYLDVEWLDSAALDDVLRLARAGLPVCLRQRPKEPGKIKTSAYARNLTELTSLLNVSADFGAVRHRSPLVTGAHMPDFWCRQDGAIREAAYTLFFANPRARNLRYPMQHGYGLSEDRFERRVELNVSGRRIPLALKFEPGQSLLVRVGQDGAVEFQDIAFEPQTSPKPSL